MIENHHDRSRLHDGANECPKCVADGPGQHCGDDCPYDMGDHHKQMVRAGLRSDEDGFEDDWLEPQGVEPIQRPHI